MTASLTPALALAYLHELSTDLRGAVVLDASGAPLAGDAALAEPARRLLADGGGSQKSAATGDATLLVERGPNGLAIALVAGPHALIPLLRHDLRAVLADLADGDFP
jgi:hypothetical protein